MAITSGAPQFPYKAKLHMLDASILISATYTYKLTLHTSGWSPAPSTDEVYADLTNELGTANGYTAGGLTLPTLLLVSPGFGPPKTSLGYPSSPISWTASGGAIPAWRYAVLRVSGTVNGKVDPLVCYFLGDATAIDIPATAAGLMLTIQLPSTGSHGFVVATFS